MASRTSVDQPLPLGVALVHPQQVAGEQRRLLAALARLDLEDHVARRRRGRAGSSTRRSASAAASRGGDQRLGLDGERRRPRPRAPGRPRRRPGRRPRRGTRRPRGPARRSAGPRGGPRAGSACSAGSASSRSSSACSSSNGATAPNGSLSHRAVLPCRRARTRQTPAGRHRRVGRDPPASRRATWRPTSCRTAPRTGPRGHRCRGSSACPCRTGGTRSTPRRGSGPTSAVLRVVNVVPQVQVTSVVTYSGWMSFFTGLSSSTEPPGRGRAPT